MSELDCIDIQRIFPRALTRAGNNQHIVRHHRRVVNSGTVAQIFFFIYFLSAADEREAGFCRKTILMN